MNRSKAAGEVVLNLALQGGGAHGAFTWGALDRLLDEPGIRFGSVSGTSAGALNGAALCTGYARAGPTGAKASLAALWDRVAAAGSLMTFLLLPLRKPGMGLWDDAMPLISPYQTNPVGMAPLRQILNAVVDVDLLKSPDAPALFVNAVEVQTGYSRLFGPSEMSLDALLASACAPLMFQAIEIEGKSYWDGSYAGNPMLWPLYQGRQAADIFMIELTPLQRAETPASAKNIMNRINEIASINGLVSEMRALDQRNRQAGVAAARMHVLSLDEGASAVEQEPSIKRTVGRVLFEMLRQEGRAKCDTWLAENRQLLGVRSSVDIGERYLAPYAPRQARRGSLMLA